MLFKIKYSLLIFLVFLLFLVSCQKKNICIEPDVLIGNECCLDIDNNKICDNAARERDSKFKNQEIKECIVKDEYNESFSLGTRCINVKDCEERLIKLSKVNPKVNLSMPEWKTLDCIQSEFQQIPKTYCETDEDCLLYFCGEECESEFQDFSYLRCENNVCEGLKYFAEKQLG